MALDTFRDNARKILSHALDDVNNENRDAVLDAYTEMFAQLYAVESYNLLNEVIADARTRLDARLSPDPLRQTIASVQTTVQDLWNTLFKG